MKSFIYLVVIVYALLFSGCLVTSNAFKGDLLKVKEELNEGFTPDELNEAFLYAVHGDDINAKNYDTIKFLIDTGADINSIYSLGDTKTHALNFSSNIKTAKLLVENGANINAIGYSSIFDRRFTLVNDILNNNIKYENTEELIKYFVEKGMNINDTDERGEIAVFKLVRFEWIENKEKLIKLFVTNGGDLNIPNKWSNTVLIFALAEDKIQEATLLIEHGADVNKANNKGYVPLIETVWKGNYELVELMLKNSANVNITDSSGKTAMYCAGYQGYDEIAKLLAQYGANPNDYSRARQDIQVAQRNRERENAELINTLNAISQQMNNNTQMIRQRSNQLNNSYSVPTYNYGNSGGCTSDYQCGGGKKCVKGAYQSTGTCMNTVNNSGAYSYSRPNVNSIGPNMNPQCRFITDCPRGFNCVNGNCVR